MFRLIAILQNIQALRSCLKDQSVRGIFWVLRSGGAPRYDLGLPRYRLPTFRVKSMYFSVNRCGVAVFHHKLFKKLRPPDRRGRIYLATVAP
jgi:hypothetical protein